MEEYYFLFGLAFLFTLFASVQDLKKREVANWLTFSLIAFALAYRLIYAVYFSAINFFILGFLGFLVFTALAHLLYYGRAFAGGDAKLFMGFGVIIPYGDYKSLLVFSLLFVFSLFLTGAVYSICYSVFIVFKNKPKFKEEFSKRFGRYKFIVTTCTVLAIVSLFLIQRNIIMMSFAVLFLIPLVYVYTKSLERCMIKMYDYRKLTEGDWIVEDIKVGGKIIKKTVHGLSLEDIKLLRKYKRNVMVKEGIPFVPAFLLTLLIMVFFFLVSPSLLENLLLLF